MIWLSRLRVLPLLVVVAALSFGVRFGEFVTGVSKDPGSANAQEQVNPAEATIDDVVKDAAMSEEPSAIGEPPPIGEVTATDTPAYNMGELPPAPMGKADGEEVNWRDATESDLEYSDVKMELFEDLKTKRKELENQQRELSVREALLKTAEQELDEKYKELVSLKSEIEELLVKQSDEEKQRTASLVKIYEGMKPKDAARIFNTLDLDILLSVVSEMSERKSAPILAAMTPERARTLTQMLMDQRSLNELSSGNLIPQQ